jgi:N-methylhydantoinase A
MPEVPVYLRTELAQGMRLSGPAIIAEDETTTFVSASFDASVNAQGCIVLERKS